MRFSMSLQEERERVIRGMKDIFQTDTSNCQACVFLCLFLWFYRGNLWGFCEDRKNGIFFVASLCYCSVSYMKRELESNEIPQFLCHFVFPSLLLHRCFHRYSLSSVSCISWPDEERERESNGEKSRQIMDEATGLLSLFSILLLTAFLDRTYTQEDPVEKDIPSVFVFLS